MANRTCSIDGCEKKLAARGWCNAHYLRWRNHGDPLVGVKIIQPAGDHEDGSRTCSECGERQSIESYSVDGNAARGRRTKCKACRSSMMKDWYGSNRERQAGRAQERYARDGDKIRQQDLSRYRRNREKRIELATEHVHRRRARLAVTNTVRGISVNSLRAIHGDICPYCGVTMIFRAANGREYIPAKATVEHILALKRGGAHTFDNTMLCCWSCNLRKNVKPLEEWLNGSITPRDDRAPTLDEAS